MKQGGMTMRQRHPVDNSGNPVVNTPQKNPVAPLNPVVISSN